MPAPKHRSLVPGTAAIAAAFGHSYKPPRLRIHVEAIVHLTSRICRELSSRGVTRRGMAAILHNGTAKGAYRMTTDSLGISLKFVAPIVAIGLVLATRPVAARDPKDPIRLAWVEGDVAGLSTIRSPDGKTIIGSINYHQHRRGQTLHIVRVARFRDGSSDEDRVEARAGKILETVRGRSIIRNTAGVATVDITIDIAGGHITGFSGLGKDRKDYDEHVSLTPGTYFGPLVFMVIKNFDGNATDDRLVYRTVVATPKPRVLDMELLRQGRTVVSRVGEKIDGVDFLMRPTVNFIVDPIIQAIAPETKFVVEPGAPPALARFEGPRNYARQKIRIE